MGAAVKTVRSSRKACACAPAATAGAAAAGNGEVFIVHS
jgi:hypothetical protein